MKNVLRSSLLTSNKRVKYIQTYRSFFSTPIHRNLPELINIDNNEIPNNLPVVKRDQMTKCYEHFKREKDNSNGIRPILLIGPPGSGKTTILKYVTEQCEKDGWVVIEMPNGREWTRDVASPMDASLILINQLYSQFKLVEAKTRSNAPEISAVFTTWLKDFDKGLESEVDPVSLSLSIMKLLKNCTEFPILLTYDDHQAIFDFYQTGKSFYMMYPFIDVLQPRQFKRAKVLFSSDQSPELLNFYHHQNRISTNGAIVYDVNRFNDAEAKLIASKLENVDYNKQIENITGAIPHDLFLLSSVASGNVEEYKTIVRGHYDTILDMLEQAPEISGGYPIFDKVDDRKKEIWVKGRHVEQIVHKRLFDFTQEQVNFYNNLIKIIFPGQAPYTGGMSDVTLLGEGLMYATPSVGETARTYHFRNDLARESIQQDLADHLYGLRFNPSSKRTQDIVKIMDSDNNPKLFDQKRSALQREIMSRLLEATSTVALPAAPEVNMDHILFQLHNISSALLPSAASLEQVINDGTVEKISEALEDPSPKKQAVDEEAELRKTKLKWLMNINQPHPMMYILVRDRKNTEKEYEKISIAKKGDKVRLHEFESAANVKTILQDLDSTIHVCVPKYIPKPIEPVEEKVKEKESIQDRFSMIQQLRQRRQEVQEPTAETKGPKKSLQELLLEHDKRYASSQSSEVTGYDLIVSTNSKQVLLMKVVNFNAPGVVKIKLYSPSLYVPEGVSHQVVILPLLRNVGEMRSNRVNIEFVDGNESKWGISLMEDYFGLDILNMRSYCEHLDILKRKKTSDSDEGEFQRAAVEMMFQRANLQT